MRSASARVLPAPWNGGRGNGRAATSIRTGASEAFHAAAAGHVPREDPLAQHDAGILPLVVAALDQFVVAAAAPAGGEDELVRQRPQPLAAVRHAQGHAVMVAVDRLGGVGAL